jgi:hypothetical protein
VIRTLLTVLSAAALAACSSATFSAPDASPPTDARHGSDAEHSPDARPLDAGHRTDGASSHDSGATDTGSSHETSPPHDSGLPHDASPPHDARDELIGPNCPGTAPSGSCGPSGATCNYPGDSCRCTFGSPPTNMLHWECSTLTAGCPQDPPGIGSSCSMSEHGLVCDYGGCSGGEKVECTSGIWVDDVGICPGG